ncbi:MAG: hypothetical protein MHPSP_002629, partial [Paramarteilia canceri]
MSSRIAKLIRLENASPQPYKLFCQFQKILVESELQRKDVQNLAGGSLNYFKNGCGTIISLQHESVYTYGRHWVKDGKDIKTKLKLRTPLEESPRGGQLTCHSPGQLIIYFILNLDLLDQIKMLQFIDILQKCLIKTYSQFGLTTFAKNHGIWMDCNQKLGFIGLKRESSITSHGIALNVNNDLSYFDDIVTCKEFNAKITSISNKLGHNLEIER